MKQRHTIIRTIAAGAAIAGLMLTAGCANRGGGTAEGDGTSFPEKDITLIVPYAAGGASDLSARTLAAELEAELGVSVIVENRTGGTGSVGLGYLAGRAADGYTIGYVPVEVTMLGHTGYDVDPAEFDNLGQIVNIPATVTVPANSPYETLEDLIADAKARPGQVSVGNNGPNGIWHASTIALGQAAEVEFNTIPFDGGAPAVAAALGGQIDAVVSGASEVAQANKDGELRSLGVLTPERVESLDGVPTAIEQGFEVDMSAWGSIGAPAGLPDAVAEKLSAAVEKAVASESYVDVITQAGNQPLHKSREDMVGFIADQDELFAALFSEE